MAKVNDLRLAFGKVHWGSDGICHGLSYPVKSGHGDYKDVHGVPRLDGRENFLRLSG